MSDIHGNTHECCEQVEALRAHIAQLEGELSLARKQLVFDGKLLITQARFNAMLGQNAAFKQRIEELEAERDEAQALAARNGEGVTELMVAGDKLRDENAKLREAMICFAREEGYDLDIDQDVVDFFMLYLK